MAAPCSLWMALVLLGALGVLPAPARASEQHSFQQDQFLGRWFSVGLVSNANWFREKKDILSVCLVVVAPAAPEHGQGVLSLTTGFLRGDEYETRSVLLTPMDTPGHYTYNSIYSGRKQDLWVETDSEYALLYTVWGTDESKFHLATLYSRTETLQDPAVKDKFTDFATAKGLPKEDIVFPPNTGKCM
ncbi:unnamed protein product [Pipistrellus nathusii]|uniref:Prostaglandin-H2 D-isomerase n=1 Tax=Pipistrellus nathusii TaxID=59473 RepID=A0ABN9Z4Y2_PIPNA